jgi:glycosyltransferase involved in cell wall biosynthesis
MLSIIIPTLNEENYLPRLFDCLKKQNFKNRVPPSLGRGRGEGEEEDKVLFAYEIIVADTGSKDKTREIARTFGCKIAKGGLPAKGKNEGAKVAKGDLFLFLDADVLLPEDFFENALKEFKERNLDIATFILVPITESRLPKVLFNIFYNYPLQFFEKRWPHGAMGILVKKELHKSLRGFNEVIKVGEDHYYVQEGLRLGKFGVIKTTKIFSSLRRFRREGWLRVGLKYGWGEIYMKLFGPIKKEIFKYEFDYVKDGKP